MDLTGLRCDHLNLGVNFKGLFKGSRPYLEKEKSDSKTDTGFVFSDPENLGHTMVSKFDSNFCYYGHPKFDISRHRLLTQSMLKREQFLKWEASRPKSEKISNGLPLCFFSGFRSNRMTPKSCHNSFWLRSYRLTSKKCQFVRHFLLIMQ
jgi:hypothetical protein